MTLTQGLPSTIKNGPYPRFQGKGFLSLSEDKNHGAIQPDRWKAMVLADRATLQVLTIDRLAAHFGNTRHLIAALVHERSKNLAKPGDSV